MVVLVLALTVGGCGLGQPPPDVVVGDGPAELLPEPGTIEDLQAYGADHTTSSAVSTSIRPAALQW